LLTRGIPLDLPTTANIVYIGCIDRTVRYVGSSTRGTRIRLREHVRDRDRARWEELWVISLADDISHYGVLLAEERVGRLLLPTDNQRPPARRTRAPPRREPRTTRDRQSNLVATVVRPVTPGPPLLRRAGGQRHVDQFLQQELLRVAREADIYPGWASEAMS
jgi:hypothetical protein